MTRKRFCKLMMARGYDRNGAARIARQCVHVGSYEELLAVHERFLPKFQDACRYLGEMIRAASDELAARIAPAIERMTAKLNEFCETVRGLDLPLLADCERNGG